LPVAPVQNNNNQVNLVQGTMA